MPVTSSRSSIKRWPSAETVLAAARTWARALLEADPAVQAVGCIGSYARGEAGVGSDLDLVVVRTDGAPRPDLLGADVDALPVPADVLHYTESELAEVLALGGRMAVVLSEEIVWMARR
jgi:uncharacterized protein